jgi:hypothetical protein
VIAREIGDSVGGNPPPVGLSLAMEESVISLQLNTVAINAQKTRSTRLPAFIRFRNRT